MKPATDASQASTDRTRPAAACGGSRALFGWSPQRLPADTTRKGRVDRLLLGTAPTVVVLAAVVGLLNLAPLLPLRGELAVDGLAALLAGGWCSLNFWRCRHAHCLVTAGGWLPLAAFAFVEAGLGRSLIGGYEQPVFIAVLALAIAFEVVWTRSQGTNAIGGPASRAAG